VYAYDEVSVRSFLYQLDFYVYFPHPNMIEAFGRAILEALASGCVTILPPRFAPTFGDAAVYCEPMEVGALVEQFYGAPSAFLNQSWLAQQRVRELFGYDRYADVISAMLVPDGPAQRRPQIPAQRARGHEDVAAPLAAR
jgi:hypothetical protein